MGFENINEEGINNPFNMGHIKVGHDDDDETSEFGIGLKAGSLTASNQLSVITHVRSGMPNMGHVSGTYYEVTCDFIKMEKEEDVNKSYNPTIKKINEIDYNNIHPFSIGSSIILSKIRETICQRMNENELSNRIIKGISETYSRFLLPNKKIFVNGKLVEKEIDLFADPKCKPFTINKKFFVLEKGNKKVIIVKKTIERVVWQLYTKEKVKDKNWIILKSGEDYIAEKIIEGYKHSYPKKNLVDDLIESCIDIDTTFAFYSDLYHTENTENIEPEKPFDNVAIYKDDRKYCNKSLENHNNGSNNFTAHKIEFSSKKIGKELGITYNKEITMDGNNELIIAIRLAIKDNRKEFSADIASSVNNKSCSKAIQKGIIDWKTCNINKLSSVHKVERELYDKNKLESQPIDPQPVDPQPIHHEPIHLEPIHHEPVDLEPVDTEPIDLEPVDTEPIDLEPVDLEHVDTEPIEPVDTEPIDLEPVDTEPIEQKPIEPEPIDLEPVDTEPIEPEPIDLEPIDIEPVDTEPIEPEPVDPQPIEPTVLLIEASELLKKKALCENFNITIEDSMRILNFVKNILKI